MEFIGTVSKLFDIQKGTSQNGNEWKKQEFIFDYKEQPEQRWSDRVLLSLSNAKIEEHQLKEGDQLRIGFEHHVREYKGKWYNDIRIYKLERVQTVAQTQQTFVNEPKEQSLPLTAAHPQTTPTSEEPNDLPF